MMSVALLQLDTGVVTHRPHPFVMALASVVLNWNASQMIPASASPDWNADQLTTCHDYHADCLRMSATALAKDRTHVEGKEQACCSRSLIGASPVIFLSSS